MIKGVDLGNYSVKDEQGLSFLSKVKRGSKNMNNVDCLYIDGENYLLGEGVYDGEYRKAYKSNLITLLYGALALGSEDVKNKVVVGLPLSQFQEDKEYLINRIMSNNRKIIKINDIEREIHIEDVEVYPEGVVSVPSEFEGIVVDIGGRTTDVCLLSTEGGRRKIRQPISIPAGTLNLETDFINSINNRYGLDLKLSDFNRIFTKGLRIYGEEKNIDFAIDCFKDFTEELVNKIQVEYSVKTNDIAILGGGAAKLYNPLKKRLPNCYLIDEPVFSNAKAFCEIGKGIFE